MLTVELALLAPLAFAAGVLVGLRLSSRYRLIRRDKDDPSDP